MAVLKRALVRVYEGHIHFETKDPKELKRMRDALRQKIRNFRLFVDNTMPDAFVLSGFESRALLTNTAVWMIERLEREGWKHDNYADIADLTPRPGHFKKSY